MDISDLFDIASAYWKSATLTAAVELGVFRETRLPRRAPEVAEALDTSLKYTTALLDGLTAIGLLRKEGDRYVLPDELRPHLDPDSPDSLADALRFNAAMIPLWAKLGDCVRSGQPAIPPNAQLGSDPERVRGFVLGMHSRAQALSPALLPHLDLSGMRRLLDVAAGPGTFSAAIAALHPEMEVTVFDLPAVSAVSRELHAEGPVGDRMTFAAGDYHDDPLPDGPFDAVLYCGAVHQEDEAHTKLVLGKIMDALAPGGRLLLVDLMLDETRTAPAFSALFEINMMLTNSMSHVHTRSSARALVEVAGFVRVEDREIPHTPYCLVEARRAKV